MKTDLYEAVTQKIVDKLEAGACPWRKGWNASTFIPSNWDGRPYRGLNWLLLSGNPYPTQVYLTFRKAKELGGCVRKGEKGHTVVFWNFLSVEDKATAKTKRIPFLRHFTVFNVAQVDGLPERAGDKAREFVPLEECERIVREMPNPPTFLEDGMGRCFYRPTTDEVHMTPRQSFNSSEGFYAVAFHELAHSTGHASRLNREGITEVSAFGSPTYSREELVAELASAFICAHVGIEAPCIDNSAAYLANWIKTLKSDAKALVWAAGRAAKAADWILGINSTSKAEDEDLEPQEA